MQPKNIRPLVVDFDLPEQFCSTKGRHPRVTPAAVADRCDVPPVLVEIAW
jgi:hypothetical protein